MTFPGLVRANNLNDVVDIEKTWDNLGINITRTPRAIGVNIGDPLEGGFFAGYMSLTANNIATHALIVAPAATGTIANVPYRLSFGTSNALSFTDGVFNMSQLEIAGINNYPFALFCKNLTIGGYRDWYWPSVLECDIAYFNLKPHNGNNTTGRGSNGIAIPQRTTSYTLSVPGQTTVPSFQTGGSQAFSSVSYWSSTDTNNQFNAYSLFFTSNGTGGTIGNDNKTFSGNGYSARAFRRVAL